MHEPNLAVALVLAALVAAALVVPAVIITLFARTSDATWTRFFYAVLALAGVALIWAFTISDTNPGDTRLYRGLVVGFALSTAIVSIVAGRLRSRPGGISFLRLLGSAVALQLLVGFTITLQTC